jgi:hypothetical protein
MSSACQHGGRGAERGLLQIGRLAAFWFCSLGCVHWPWLSCSIRSGKSGEGCREAATHQIRVPGARCLFGDRKEYLNNLVLPGLHPLGYGCVVARILQEKQTNNMYSHCYIMLFWPTLDWIYNGGPRRL